MKPKLTDDKPKRVVAIHQPNYAPWCGYFAKMRHCDVFIFLDDAQMPGGQSYVYRTRIRTQSGTRWLSVPTRYHLGDAISQVRFADDRWSRKHLGALRAEYGRSASFKEVWPIVAPLYDDASDSLSDFNQRLIVELARYLGLTCSILRSSELLAPGASDERLIALIQAVGGTRYLSGKGGQNYQDSEKFRIACIDLDVCPYLPKPYHQIHGGFTSGLSVLDSIFNLGKDAARLLTYDSPTLEPEREGPGTADGASLIAGNDAGCRQIEREL